MIESNRWAVTRTLDTDAWLWPPATGCEGTTWTSVIGEYGAAASQFPTPSVSPLEWMWYPMLFPPLLKNVSPNVIHVSAVPTDGIGITPPVRKVPAGSPVRL